MLGFLFGFNARLGRLNYFFSTIALAVGMTAAVYALVSHAIQDHPKGIQSPADLLSWPVIALAMLFAGITFTLQSMRIRDIGWDPVCVIPGWIALLIIDNIVASRIPAWSLGAGHQGTMAGALVNFGLLLALTFWPGGEYAGSTPSFREPREPDYPSRGKDTNSVTAARIARATGGEFGRRSV